jgi:hypothetical protein
MTQAKNVTPGFPALSPSFTPAATASGALDVASITDPNKVTPNRTFPYAMPDGSTKTFYNGMPAVVSPGVKAALVALGWVS